MPSGPTSASVTAIAGLILSMGLVAVGNGLMFAYIPLRLDAEGFGPTWAGTALTAMSAGGIAGCLLTPSLIRRVGHARAYMVFTAMILLSNVTIGSIADPVAWLGARGLYGFAINALFIIAQSWLNDAVPNAIRGRVMAVFYIAYIAGLGVGYTVLSVIDIASVQGPLICISFATLSLLPVGLTRLTQPPAPPTARIALVRAWRISPVGVAGKLAVGGLSMLITGFTPIHATANGYSQQQVSLLMAFMPVGTVLLQFPLGWLSDRIDRRLVLAGAAFGTALFGVAAGSVDHAAIVLVVAIYLVWDGLAESIYSLSNAHANDRAEKGDLVSLSSSLLLCWSLSGFVVPAVATMLTAAYGTQSFIHVVVAIALAYGLFVVARMTRRPQPATACEFTPMTAQVPPVAAPD